MPEKRTKNGKTRRWAAGALLTGILAGSVICYNAAIETELLTLCAPNLPEAFAGFRVVLVSDLHGREFGEDNAWLLQRVAQAQPDLIALCGDLLDSAEEIPAMAQTAARLCEIAPVYYVTGNHEWGARCVNDTIEALRTVGVVCLENDFVWIERDGVRIAVAGVHDLNSQANPYAGRELVGRIREQEAEGYILMLSHRNDAPESWQPYGVQAVLSGHGHGGVIRLPLVGGLLDTDRTFFAKYTSGLYRAGDTTVAVSRGLGGARIFCRPHLPVVVLEAAR